MSEQEEKKILGTWQGSLDIGNGMSMPLVFKFAKSQDGKVTGSMQSPAPSQQFIDFDTVTCNTAGNLACGIEKIKGRFEGKLSAKNELSGTWTQAGISHPLNISHTEEYNRQAGHKSLSNRFPTWKRM